MSRARAAEKVLRLKRLAERASKHEAEAAMLAATRIVEAFALTDDDVRSAASSEVRTAAEFLVETTLLYQAILAEAAALHCGARLKARPIRLGVAIRLHGTDAQRDAATALFARLRRFADGLQPPVQVVSFFGFHDTWRIDETKSWRTSFQVGIALGIFEQIKARVEERARPKPGAMIVRTVEGETVETSDPSDRPNPGYSPSEQKPLEGARQPPSQMGFPKVAFDAEAVELGKQAAREAAAVFESDQQERRA